MAGFFGSVRALTGVQNAVQALHERPAQAPMTGSGLLDAHSAPHPKSVEVPAHMVAFAKSCVRGKLAHETLNVASGRHQYYMGQALEAARAGGLLPPLYASSKDGWSFQRLCREILGWAG